MTPSWTLSTAPDLTALAATVFILPASCSTSCVLNFSMAARILGSVIKSPMRPMARGRAASSRPSELPARAMPVISSSGTPLARARSIASPACAGDPRAAPPAVVPPTAPASSEAPKRAAAARPAKPPTPPRRSMGKVLPTASPTMPAAERGS